MTNNISGTGLEVNIVADSTFPSGFIVNQFADDSDPLDSGDMQIGDTAMGLNGDLVTWSIASPIPLILRVIPDSDDDINLSILAEANRVGRGKTSAKDLITVTLIYPDGKIITLTDGAIINAPAANSIASAGRKKSKTYTFAFENKTGGN